MQFVTNVKLLLHNSEATYFYFYTASNVTSASVTGSTTHSIQERVAAAVKGDTHYEQCIQQIGPHHHQHHQMGHANAAGRQSQLA